MNNRTVAENWRQQTGKAHKSGSRGNLYYVGRAIYSYGGHFPIAFITGKQHKGKDIILWNIDRYSHSTAKHQHHVSSQLYNDQRIGISTELLQKAIAAYEHKGKLNAVIRSAIRIEQEQRIRKAIRSVELSRKYKEIIQSEVEALEQEASALDWAL